MAVARPHNMGTQTEAAYWASIRSALRGAFQWWKPMAAAKKAAKVAYGKYRCALCGEVFPSKEVQVDHIVPCGSLKSYADLGPFLQRLTAESPDDFQVLCKARCHKWKTYRERYGKPHWEEVNNG